MPKTPVPTRARVLCSLSSIISSVQSALAFLPSRLLAHPSARFTFHLSQFLFLLSSSSKPEAKPASERTNERTNERTATQNSFFALFQFNACCQELKQSQKQHSELGHLIGRATPQLTYPTIEPKLATKSFSCERHLNAYSRSPRPVCSANNWLPPSAAAALTSR